MNYQVYRMYAHSKRMIEQVEACPNDHGEEELTLVADMKLSHVILEEAEPEYARRYKMEQEMFSAFTQEQKDFICSQIGWWYLIWKDNMWVDDKPNQHWLGRGKEDLKTMICGD